MNLPPQDRVSPRAQLALTMAPILASATGLTLVWVSQGWDRAAALVTIAISTFFYFGKFVVVTPALSDQVPFSTWELAALVTFMDTATACFVAGNLHVFNRIPYFGKKLAGLERYGRFTLEQKPAMRRMARLGVILFVMFPLAGTGAVGGSILGRLLGMTLAWILICVFLGGLLGSFAMAALAEAVALPLQELRGDTWFQFLGVGILALFIGLFVWRAARLNRRLEELEVMRQGGQVPVGDPPKSSG